MIHGQSHKGSTYHIARQVKEALINSDEKSDVKEFFLPTDGPGFCCGCFKCVVEGSQKCPDADKVQPIISAMLDSDIIVTDSPTYVLEMSGQLKAFFEHMGYMWMSHRPEEAMFSKKVIAISTAAGTGHENVVKTINKQFFYLGAAKCYSLAFAVGSMTWNDVKDEKKNKIAKEVSKLSAKIIKTKDKNKVSIKTKFMFWIMRLMQKMNNWTPIDKEYWQEKGWLKRKRPWKHKK